MLSLPHPSRMRNWTKGEISDRGITETVTPVVKLKLPGGGNLPGWRIDGDNEMREATCAKTNFKGADIVGLLVNIWTIFAFIIPSQIIVQ